MIIEAKNVIKRYGDLIANDNLSLEINKGEVVGLVGPNGAGKTTFLNALLGNIAIESGEIKIFGKDIRKQAIEIKQNIGVVPQDLAFYNELTAFENVMFFGSLFGLKGEDLKNKVKDALNFTKLWEKKDTFPSSFSGGMKRRLNIACSIVHRPSLLLFDEPTVGVDPQSRNHILEAIKILNQEGSTIIYTSHYMEEVETICSRVVIIDKGRVIADGTIRELEEFVKSEQLIFITIDKPNYTIVDEIKKVYGVNDCSIINNVLTVITKYGAENISQIMECISKTNCKLLQINMEKANLEDLFLTLTGRTLRD
ncbi:MAG: transporter ATP-binding protein [Haloplasmataceae bacterium]|nr:transporter ATP-binding protein [Haloplasmataceae bacterium]